MADGGFVSGWFIFAAFSFLQETAFLSETSDLSDIKKKKSRKAYFA